MIAFWFIIYVLFAFAKGQNEKDCPMPCSKDHKETFCKLLPDIKDNTSPGYVLGQFKNLHNHFMYHMAGPHAKYVSYELGYYDSLILTLSEKFKEFDEFEEGDMFINMNFTLEYQCNDYSKHEAHFEQKVLLTHNYKPEFFKHKYEYALTMPHPPGYVINEDDLISASVLYFTEKDNITFSVDADFEIVPRGVKDRWFYAALKTGKWIDIKTEKEYTITATTSDNPPLTETVKLIIIRDPNTSTKFTECPKNECKTECEEESCGGPIAGIVILTLLLATIVVCTFAFYYFRLRPLLPR